MTAEDNGVPEDDDPFAYLYRQDGDDGTPRAAAPQQPGVPRTSYQQATQVGRAQYGQPRPQQPPQQQYAPQLPHQAAQTAQSGQPPYAGGRAGSRAGGSGSGGGSNRAVMFGAVAVVAAVAIGVVVAMASGGKGSASAGSSTGPSASTSSSSSSSSSAPASAAATAPGKTNVSAMTLGGGAALSSTVTGGASTDGKSVALSAAGQSVTWTVSVPTAGQYYFWVHYANAGADSQDPVTVNGKVATGSPIDLKDWSGATTLDQAWQSSWTPVTLNAGSNTIELAYGGGTIDVDQFVVNTTTKPYPWN
jgi:hypothetical protein